MPVTPEEIRNDLSKQILEAHREEYKELGSTRQILETKAQGNIAIAGIFIAGLFIFIRDVDKFPSCVQKIILVSTITCVILSVICSLLVLIVRVIPETKLGETVENLINPILEKPDSEITNAGLKAPIDQKRAWESINPTLRGINKTKGILLFIGQVFLSAAILFATIVLIIKIIYG